MYRPGGGAGAAPATRSALPDNACGSDLIVEYSPDRRFIVCSENTDNAIVHMRVVDAFGHQLIIHTASAGDASDIRFYWMDDALVVIGLDVVDIHTGTSVSLTQPASIMWRVPGHIYLHS